MNTSSSDIFHPANILGINREEWDIVIPYSGLFDINKKIIRSSWDTSLSLYDIEFRHCQSVVTGGDHTHSLWFRIVGLKDMSFRISRASSINIESIVPENLVPCSTDALNYLDEYYENVVHKISTRVFREPELLALFRSHQAKVYRQKFDISSQLDVNDFEEDCCEEDDIDSESKFYSSRSSMECSDSTKEDKDAFLKLAMSAPKAWQNEFVKSYLESHTVNNMFEIPTQGSRKIKYWRFPIMRKQTICDDKMYVNYSQNCPREQTRCMLMEVFGSVENGVELTLRQLYSIDPTAAMKGLKKAGAQPFIKLSSEQTIALQSFANLTDTARIAVGRFLRAANDGLPIIASDKECRKVKPNNKATLYEGTFLFESTLENGEVEKINLAYTYSKPIECFEMHLRDLRDANHNSIGIDLGNGVVVAFNIMGDHGGDHMQMAMVMALYEGCKQKHLCPLGSFQSKETHHILANTIVPPIEESIGQMNLLRLVVVEWPTGFDYVLVPTTECGDVTDRFRCPTAFTPTRVNCILQLVPTDENATTYQFTRGDIPVEMLSYKCIPLVMYMCSDLQFIFMVYGRMGHASSKCYCCDATSSRESFGGGCYLGEAWTLARIQSEIEDYKTANLPDGPEHDPISAEELSELKSRSKANSALSGIKGDDVLFKNVDISNVRSPYLHIRLGIGNELVNAMKYFIRNKLEKDTPRMADARGKMNTDKDKLVILKRDKQQYIDAVSIRIAKEKWSAKEYDKLQTNQLYLLLQEREASPQPMSAAQRTQLNTFYARSDVVRQYEPDSATRVEGELFISESEKEIIRLGKAIEAAVIHARKSSELFATVQSERSNRPIEHQWEDILEEFDVRFQQFYTMSLVGEHVHRVMENSREICSRTAELMLSGVTDVDLREDIVLFMEHLEELMDTFDWICSVMNSMEIQSEDTIADFILATEHFGKKYRQYLNKSATPKVHLLESHVPRELSMHKRLGIFAEDPIERLHHITKVSHRRYANVKRWNLRQQLIAAKVALIDTPSVAAIVKQTNKATSRKRKVSVSEDSELKSPPLKSKKLIKREGTILKIKDEGSRE